MSHWQWRGCGSAVLAIALSLVAVHAAEPPTEPAALDYWPMQPGMTWIYQDDQGRQQVVHVVGTATVDGEQATMIEETTTHDPHQLLHLYYAVRDGQIVWLALERVGGSSGGTLQRQPALVILWPAAVAVGTRWRMSPAFTQSPESVVERQETISVPAGTYQCLVVVTTMDTGKTSTTWMTPGIGKVRTVTTDSKGRQASSVELRRFIPTSP